MLKSGKFAFKTPIGSRCIALQTLVNICATELEYLDMAFNVNKLARMRFGFRFKNHCAIS